MSTAEKYIGAAYAVFLLGMVVASLAGTIETLFLG